MKSRILICGGRKFADHKLFHATMEDAKIWFAPKYCIINGLAPGADALAHQWAMMQGVCSICVPANWGIFKDDAGPRRNQWMLEFTFPDLVIAFPGNSGTAHMVKISKDAGVDVWEV